MDQRLRMSKDLYKAVCPIFLDHNDRTKTEQIGSGVLLQIATEKFLLTAAHVTDLQKEGALLIPGKDGLTQIYGNLAHLAVPRGFKRIDDKMDIAYYRLPRDLAGNLHPDLVPLTRDHLFLSDNMLEGDVYTFVGYPWRKSRALGAKATMELFTYTGRAAPKKKYEMLGYNNHLHVLIKFDRKKCIRDGKVLQAPLPHGLSGGAVFRWPKDIKKPLGQDDLNLVAIAHSYHEKQNLIAGTNLNLYLACIFSKNPDLIELTQEKPSYHPTPSLVGLVWYRREEWPRVLAEFDDAKNMHDTWDEWRQSAENSVEQLARGGAIAYPVELSVDEITTFCRKRGIKNNGQARSELANIRMMESVYGEEVSRA